MKKLCSLSEVTWLIQLPEWLLIWSMYGDSVESDTLYGDFMVKLIWRLPRVFIEKTLFIKLPENLHEKYLLSPYYPHSFYILWSLNIFPAIHMNF